METHLGISGIYSHDSAACIVVDGQIIAASEEERYLHEKHTGAFPVSAINFCLNYANILPEQIDVVSFPYDAKLRYKNSMLFNAKNAFFKYKFFTDNGYSEQEVLKSYSSAFEVENRIIRAMDDVEEFVKQTFPNAIFEVVNHHLAHASSSFFVSGFKNSLVLVVDLIGEWESTSLYLASQTSLTKLMSISFPNSIGKLYQTFTKYLGFRPNSDEFKVMGLAAYGTNKYCNFFNKLVNYEKFGNYSLNDELLLFCRSIRPEWDNSIIQKLGNPRKENEEITQNHSDIAYALQKTTENLIIHVLQYHSNIHKIRNLCIAGGVGLNALANQKIRESKLFDEIFIQPASNDAGTALGSAVFTHNKFNGKKFKIPANYYLGDSFDTEYINNAIYKSGLKHKIITDEDIAKLLTMGKIIGLFQGRMEFGPRALGNRSILADPRTAIMKDLLNKKIKFREKFRPFAPVILEHKASEYFEGCLSSPFMTMTYTAKEITKQNAPAIVHSDLTSRVQTVNKKQNSRLYNLLLEFEKYSNVPILLNTSLNINNDTIARTPEDAIKTFKGCDMDYLIIENLLIEK